MIIFFCYVAPCILVELYRLFKGACYFRRQGERPARRSTSEDSHCHSSCSEILKSHTQFHQLLCMGMNSMFHPEGENHQGVSEQRDEARV